VKHALVFIAAAAVAATAPSPHKIARNNLVFVASPYVAGPYVEGEYEIALPVTSPIIAALKSGYRDSFAAQRQ
jgi:hypothetical protein